MTSSPAQERTGQVPPPGVVTVTAAVAGRNHRRMNTHGPLPVKDWPGEDLQERIVLRNIIRDGYSLNLCSYSHLNF